MGGLNNSPLVSWDKSQATRGGSGEFRWRVVHFGENYLFTTSSATDHWSNNLHRNKDLVMSFKRFDYMSIILFELGENRTLPPGA